MDYHAYCLTGARQHVKAWKLENKWARLLEKQLNRANRDNGILGSELQYLENRCVRI